MKTEWTVQKIEAVSLLCQHDPHLNNQGSLWRTAVSLPWFVSQEVSEKARTPQDFGICGGILTSTTAQQSYLCGNKFLCFFTPWLCERFPCFVCQCTMADRPWSNMNTLRNACVKKPRRLKVLPDEGLHRLRLGRIALCSQLSRKERGRGRHPSGLLSLVDKGQPL